MENNIYEVSRDEYVGFVRQLKENTFNVETLHLDDMTILKIKSKRNDLHLTTRIIPEEDSEHYYIFNFPDPEDRIPAKPIRQITLTSKEQVQRFFEALNNLQKQSAHD